MPRLPILSLAFETSFAAGTRAVLCPIIFFRLCTDYLLIILAFVFLTELSSEDATWYFKVKYFAGLHFEVQSHSLPTHRSIQMSCPKLSGGRSFTSGSSQTFPSRSQKLQKLERCVHQERCAWFYTKRTFGFSRWNGKSKGKFTNGLDVKGYTKSLFVCLAFFGCTHNTMFENHRKSLIQLCEWSELRLHFECYQLVKNAEIENWNKTF